MLRLITSILLMLLYFSSVDSTLDDSTEEKTCAPYQFTCTSKACIHMVWRCDGSADCNDGSDEEKCPKTTCTNAHFRCNDGQCIPDRWICDGGHDCDDESDEDPSLCANKTCSGFRCKGNDQCIPEGWKCDGKVDCPQGDDEKECLHQCSESEFSCGDSLCINKKWQCDGHEDCDDGSDERNCSKKCNDGDFICANGQCVNEKWWCDGDRDCSDGSDESNCTAKELMNQTCESNMFQCSLPNDEVKCISESWRCDGDADCHDGSDEENCKEVTCTSDERMCDMNYCIKKAVWCDGDEDCLDGSDEKDCNITTTPAPGCAANQFDCNGDGSKCILDSYICDSNDDCGNFADEKSCPPPHVCHGPTNGGCQHICVPTPEGRVCECNSGFQLRNGSETECEDIDECQVLGTCSQICVNRKGTYKCECGEGYFLTDHRYCKADSGSTPELFFTDGYSIRRYELATYHYELLLGKDIPGATVLDYDIRNNMVYWTGTSDSGHASGYHSANMETGDVQEFPSPHLTMPDGLAVDWVHGNLYITDTGYDHIVVFRLNTNYSKVLISEGLDEPRAIVVDPYHGWMYFTDWGSDPKIEKCGMNGKQRQVLVERDIVWPNGLTIDYVDSRLYFADAKMHHVGSTDLDGGDFRRVVKNHKFLSHPFSITVFEDYIYWTNWGENAIHKMSKYGTGNITTVPLRLKTPYDIDVYHIYRQPSKKNHCGVNNGGCSHLCLPVPQLTTVTRVIKRFECACPDGMVLEDTYQCVNGTEAVTQKPNKPSNGSDDGKSNRPQTSKVIPPTPKPTTEQPSIDSKQTTEKSEVTIKYEETTMKSDGTTEKQNLTGTQLSQDGGSPAIGHVAGIAVGAILLVALCAGIVIFILVKRYKKKNVKSMNFDNPVYRKTTTDDQLIMDKESSNTRLERESMQPLNQDPEIV